MSSVPIHVYIYIYILTQTDACGRYLRTRGDNYGNLQGLRRSSYSVERREMLFRKVVNVHFAFLVF